VSTRPAGILATSDPQATGADGLTSAEAAALLAEVGPNTLPSRRKPGPLQRLLAQITNPLIYVLLGSAALSAVLGHAVDTAVILAVVAINAAVGIVQEGRAEKALEAIRSMVGPRASVRRDGRRLDIPAREVVPGDILLLEAGDRVAADARLIKERNLCIDESILTGESVPVSKITGSPHGGAGGENDIAFSGTLVVAGQGTGTVTATGADSRLGQITALLAQVEERETPLVRQMNIFARRATTFILALSVLTFAYAWWVGGYPVAEAFMIVVGMAVAAIPEGLPAVTTITMAVGVQRMAGRNAVVRRMPAIETLGCVTTICADKTGTLTKNEMTVTWVITATGSFEVSGVGYAPAGTFRLGRAEGEPREDPTLMSLLRSGALCSEAALRRSGSAWVVDGDPLEGALLVAARKAGYDADALRRALPRIDEIPFDAAYRYMASLHREEDGKALLCVKGAPERLLDMCVAEFAPGGPLPLDRGYWAAALERLAGAGCRVLAIASKAMPATEQLADADVRGLVLEGLVGLIDPPRAEAVAAIAECRRAGIDVKMITGDHAVTARAIAAGLGFDAAEAPVTGDRLDAADDAELQRLAAQVSIFARTAPEHKLRLVDALQASGNVVAMTGDGVNDAPALRRADVGVAMGRGGTEVAKEAAAMVLVDDNFASIVAAVREGRAVYDNLTKVIGWTLPTSGGQTFIIVLAIAFGLTLPLTPVQILWVNTVTVVCLGLVLAFEPAEPDIMARRPRAASEGLLSPLLLWRTAIVSLLFAAGAFGVFRWGIGQGYAIEAARTLVVNAIVAMGVAYLFNIRYLRSASLTWQGVAGTPAVLLGVGSVMGLQIAFTYLPAMNVAFETRPLPLAGLVAVAAVGALLFAILEIEKYLRQRFAPPAVRALRRTAVELHDRRRRLHSPV
jgi:magnesium-transporting ATPase (P-type)